MNQSRYIRQIALEELGIAGQEKLCNAKVVIIGCGGLGSIAAPYLAGAGVGHLTLVDGDKPHISNLHRQVFFSEQKSEKTKAEALAEHIVKLNSEVEVNVISEMLTSINVEEIIKGADVVLECTDDILTKYLVNDACHLMKVPMIYGAIYKYDGYVSFFRNGSKNDIHLRDIFPEPDTELQTCSQVGVLNTIAGTIGILQANEAIKFITGLDEALDGVLLSYDVLSNDQLKLKLKKNYFKELSFNLNENSMDLEIELNEVLKEPENYTIISIIEADEELNEIPGTIQKPLSEFEINDWKAPDDKPVVFCCARGRRSLALCQDLVQQDLRANVLSLKGGLISLQDPLKV